ncbi:hypothetical protein B566_EDAN006295 [Ephemera danica]|nr:hypothetical protein B566_EDAN006295 [Ephemera danica]
MYRRELINSVSFVLSHETAIFFPGYWWSRNERVYINNLVPSLQTFTILLQVIQHQHEVLPQHDNIFLLALLAFAGMVSAQCRHKCPGGGPRICAIDIRSTSAKREFKEFRNSCEMEKYNCKNRETIIRNHIYK